jgi:superfamily II DNA or RNA helicase
MNPGTLVRYRERDWVVLPSEDPQLLMLRPIGGSAREACGVLRSLADRMAYSLPFERVTPSQFPVPDADAVQDHAAVRLLLQAARLLLRDGAAPFRSLGHLSARPRPYQYVPMLMGLRQDTVRVLISDDVGVGKSLEAILIGRELLARGEVRRIAVLCPPYLCDQWQRELAEKAHIEAEVIRSGTVARLERLCPANRSIFQQHRNFVASIDTIKGDRYRETFLLHCPDFVIVDEVHGAARPPGDRRSRSQQQRHDLLCQVAANANRHLVLLTATPHSGVEESFLSLLGLLRPEFATLDLAGLSDDERDELSKHFVQRRRPDVKRWMGQDTPFPERDPWPAPSGEHPYTFSEAYRAFYADVYEFARGLVESADTLTGWKRRMRFWSALALMRCVTSSPAAAEASLLRRLGGEEDASVDALDASTDEDLEETFEPVLYDPTEAESVVDAPPTAVFEAQELDASWPDADRRRMRSFAKRAGELRGKHDAKLQAATEAVRACLKDGYHPIVWCRYIATSDYVAEQLQATLGREFRDLRVTSITGTVGEDERRLKLEELSRAPQRVLVATDCLSEGINLQDHFNAVLHFDLPWNPNRLEQREGRVDRFGQVSSKVRTVLVYGQDNPVDGAVLDVLIRKAREIHKALGIHVPVPVDSETVMETVLKSVFARSYEGQRQLSLFDESDMASQVVKRFHYQMDLAAERERETRSRFAQRRIQPDEVERELAETDGVLGDPGEVQSFLLDASQRMGFGFRRCARFRGRRPEVWEVDVAPLPPAARQALGSVPDPWPVTFDTPVPEGVAYIGRSHRLIECLAEHLVDQAFYPSSDRSPAARCGAIRTDAVARRTTLLLLRPRYLIHEREGETPSLAEETLAWGYRGLPPDIEAFTLDEARRLVDEATSAANLSAQEKSEVVDETLDAWEALQPQLDAVLDERAARLTESHRRIRSLTRAGQVRIEPQRPPDLLGVLVLVPVPKGAAR